MQPFKNHSSLHSDKGRHINFTHFIHLFIFREKGREREREGENHQCVVASHTLPTGDLACNPGMCPDWESNQRPFGSQASTQSTEPHQPGRYIINLKHQAIEQYAWYDSI